jgi:pimeloyl-ACP methyl ester carboxylesterase
MRIDHTTPPLWNGFWRWCFGAFAAAGLGVACGAAEPAGKSGDEKLPAEPEAITLPTTDGVEIGAWVYRVAADTAPLATVLLLHDLGGSHESVEPLAKALQAGGCNVVAPDLRGHGKSQIAKLARAAGAGGQSGLLKSGDFAAMAATAGGRLREQSAVRGDVEVVRNWIKQQANQGTLDLDKLYIVGSGLGAAVGATWTALDAAWPPIASGPQGGQVRGLVMIDPPFVTKGFSIAKPLAVEPLKSSLPIMFVSGGEDGDASKVFDQLKRARPSGWYDSRLFDGETRKNTSPAKDSEASLVFLKLGGKLTGDKLAAARAADPRQPDPAKLILAFIQTAAGR